MAAKRVAFVTFLLVSLLLLDLLQDISASLPSNGAKNGSHNGSLNQNGSLNHNLLTNWYLRVPLEAASLVVAYQASSYLWDKATQVYHGWKGITRAPLGNIQDLQGNQTRLSITGPKRHLPLFRSIFLVYCTISLPLGVLILCCYIFRKGSGERMRFKGCKRLCQSVLYGFTNGFRWFTEKLCKGCYYIWYYSCCCCCWTQCCNCLGLETTSTDDDDNTSTDSEQSYLDPRGRKKKKRKKGKRDKPKHKKEHWKVVEPGMQGLNQSQSFGTTSYPSTHISLQQPSSCQTLQTNSLSASDPSWSTSVQPSFHQNVHPSSHQTLQSFSAPSSPAISQTQPALRSILRQTSQPQSLRSASHSRRYRNPHLFPDAY